MKRSKQTMIKVISWISWIVLTGGCLLHNTSRPVQASESVPKKQIICSHFAEMNAQEISLRDTHGSVWKVVRDDETVYVTGNCWVRGVKNP